MKHRAFNADRRIATAVQTKDGKTFQVYPNKALFDTVDDWKAAWVVADRFETYTGRVKPINDRGVDRTYVKRIPSVERRREVEFAEFLDADYRWLITSVTRVDAESIRLVLNDGSEAVVKRSTDYLEPPHITRNGVHLIILPSNYSPAVTAVRYLLTLLFVKPEPCVF